MRSTTSSPKNIAVPPFSIISRWPVFHCNNHKGPNIAGIDDESNQVTRLFHPRRDSWDEHFRWDGPVLVGRTAIGRATVAVLEIDLPHRVAHRQALIEEGAFPVS